MGLIGSHSGRRAGHIKHMVHIRIRLKISQRPLGHLSGTLYGGSFGQLELYREVTLILRRHETLRHHTVHKPYEHQGQSKRHIHASRLVEGTTDAVTIEPVAASEPQID